LLTNKLHGAESFEKMIIAQLVTKRPILMEPKDSLLYSQNPTTKPYSEAVHYCYSMVQPIYGPNRSSPGS
jgi:hypothetical protein